MEGSTQGNMQNNMYQQNKETFGQNVSQKAPDFTKWIIISVFQMACCCQITGILSLVMVILADSDFKKGLYTEYASKMKTAKIASVVGIILGFIVSVLYISSIGLDFILNM